MTPQRGPHYAKNCPFHIKPNHPTERGGVGGPMRRMRRPRLRPAKAVEAGSAPTSIPGQSLKTHQNMTQNTKAARV